jgi:hypothetical protein
MLGFRSEKAPQEDAEEEAQEAPQEDALGASAQEVALRYRLCTFLSDYGTSDEFVGVCHAVFARIAPEVRIIDVAHGVRGLRACAAVLEQALPYAPEAVHLAVCDPGVGTERRGLVLETALGPLVGPDNGLLLPAAARLGGVVRAFELRAPEYRLDDVSATFHGRDVFAPAAAHLALGVAPSAFGPPATGLVELAPARVESGEGWLEADVLRAEGFGNVQLAARAEHLSGLGSRVRVGDLEASVVRTFADIAPGELAVLVDSAGQLSVAVNQGSAWERLNRPSVVRLTRVE